MGHSIGYVTCRALTCPVRMLPDFLVIGAQRGGTSAFYYHLSEHPSVKSSPTKELNYFNKNYYKGSLWYRAHFPLLTEKWLAEYGRHQHLITGEASPDYMFHPLAPERVAATVPAVKLVALLRDPVERAYSHYRLYTTIGKEAASFEEAITREERVWGDVGYSASDAHTTQAYDSYLGNGMYADQLQRWLRLFPREQMLILRSEDFYAAPYPTLQRALAFLGVAPDTLPQKTSYAHYDGYSERSEARRDAGMDPAMRQRLRAYFAPHSARLQALVGVEFGWQCSAEHSRSDIVEA